VIAVVTGATQGLGLALAEGLARRLGPRDRVYLTGGTVPVCEPLPRDWPSLEPRCAAMSSTSVTGLRCHSLAEEIHSEHGGVDILFSNAAARLVHASASAPPKASWRTIGSKCSRKSWTRPSSPIWKTPT